MNSIQQQSNVYGFARRALLVVSALVFLAGTQTAVAQCPGEEGGDPTRCGLPAPQYPVPFATPRPTTQTNFTYPPMMPHHSLPHYRNVYSYRHAEGLSRTNVIWHSQPFVSGLRRLHNFIEIPR